MTIVGNQIAVSLDTILFATDFSPSAETARLYVQALAARYQSQVRLMHVVDLGAAFKAPDAGLSIDIFRRIGEESLARLGSELVSEKIRVETVLCEGIDPAAEILQAAQDRIHRPAGDRHPGPQRPGPAGPWIDRGRADSSRPSVLFWPSGPAVPRAKAADKFSADRLCHGFLSGGCESVRVCSHRLPRISAPISISATCCQRATIK